MNTRKHAVYEMGVACFCEDKVDSWRIGRIVTMDAATATLEACDEDGTPSAPSQTFIVAADRLAPLECEWLRPVRDLLEMTMLLDPLLLEQIRRRYWQDIIYTARPQVQAATLKTVCKGWGVPIPKSPAEFAVSLLLVAQRLSESAKSIARLQVVYQPSYDRLEDV